MSTTIAGDKTIAAAFKEGVEDVLHINTKNYNSFYYTTASGNCKHCHINNIGYSLHDNNYEATCERLDELFKSVGKLTFGVNLTNTTALDNLKKKFTMISCQSIPTGYNTGYQHHAIFLTNYDSYSGYAGYKARILAGQGGTTNKISLTQVARAKTYKSKFWLGKYLEGLVIK